jgi:transposase InsO family protein
VWQYTAIEVVSAFSCVELHASERNLRSRHTRELLHHVRARTGGRRMEAQEVSIDNGSKPRAKQFGHAVEQCGARQRFIRAGRASCRG